MGRLSLRSLRVRLLLLILFVLVATGSLAAWLAGRAIADRFEQYLITRQEASEARQKRLAVMLPALLAAEYQRTERWGAVSELVNHFGDVTGERILVTDAQGEVVADSANDPASQAASLDFDSAEPIRVGDGVIALLHLPPLPLVSNSASEKAYIAQVNRSLLIAIAVAGGLGLVLTLALSRGILGRVAALTRAVRQMEQGDLSQRMPNGAQDEFGQLAHAFNSMADSLARIEQLRRNMVSDVAHELRTPLSNIRGYLEAVQDGVVEPTPGVISSLHEEAMLLHRLINDLQELAVAEAGQLKLARQPVAIGDLVERAVQIVQGRVNGNRRFTTEIAPLLPPLHVDAERIGQVLRNLLNNAVEYSPVGGAIIVGARQVNGGIQVNVYNEGAGISLEHLPNVFERFYRVDDSRTRATGGSGLGLAIVKQLVEAHGGHVWAESAANQYANFIFTLPIEAS
jgi:signal transduction histidine kinase